MAEVYFYHLLKQNTYDVLLKLLIKVYESNRKSIVIVGKKDSIDRLDSFLWTFNSSQFLPHNTIKDRNVDLSPIVIMERYQNPNKASIVFLIEKGQLEIDLIKCHERVCILFNNEDVERLEYIEKLKLDLYANGIDFKYWSEISTGWTEK